jgi:hypothetical protein
MIPMDLSKEALAELMEKLEASGYSPKYLYIKDDRLRELLAKDLLELRDGVYYLKYSDVDN